jgi:predicted O-methyltransferase YrrM
MRALAIGFLAVIVVGAMAYVTMAQPGGGAPGPGVAPKGPGREPTKFTSPVMPKDDAEKKILDVLEEMNKNERGGMMNVPMEDGRILRMLAETTGAKQVVEIGTSNGFSGIWWCMALRKTGGKLTTFEIDAARAALARKNFKRAGVDELVTLVEGDAHVEALKLKDKNVAIDILFLDADKEGYLDYLKNLLPLVRPGGLIVAHNMTPRMADPRYIKAITTNPDLETIFINMQASGVGITLKKR